MPRMFFDDPNGLAKMLLSPHGDGFLQHLWKRSAEVAQLSPMDSRGLGCSSFPTSGGVTLVVHMPPPEGMTECFFMGLRIRKGKRTMLFLSGKPQFDYFTLELSMDLSSGQPTTVLGGWTPEGSHSNFGSGPGPDPAQFVAALQSH